MAGADDTGPKTNEDLEHRVCILEDQVTDLQEQRFESKKLVENFKEFLENLLER